VIFPIFKISVFLARENGENRAKDCGNLRIQQIGGLAPPQKKVEINEFEAYHP
jgi:hypothetical protein